MNDKTKNRLLRLGYVIYVLFVGLILKLTAYSPTSTYGSCFPKSPDEILFNILAFFFAWAIIALAPLVYGIAAGWWD